MGTPAYMPPEQARGEIDRLDERADVFGLGAILCEILTGKPPYTGANGTEVLTQAAMGDLNQASQCTAGIGGADPELIRLAWSCLGPAPEEGPAPQRRGGGRGGGQLPGRDAGPLPTGGGGAGRRGRPVSRRPRHRARARTRAGQGGR